MIEAFSYTFMQRALLAGFLIAITVGLFGPYLVLRRMSLLGDGIAHLSFGGIALGLLLGIDPLISALAISLAGAIIVHTMIKRGVYGEASVALILSFGVGLGILIIGATRGFTADLFSYLIGSLLTVSVRDIILISILTFITITYVVIMRRELLLLSFNTTIARLKSPRARIADLLFPIITALIIVVSIRAVGILLVSALIVLPALISMKMSRSFHTTIITSVFVSILSIILGILVSYQTDLPPSGTIVMILFIGFFIAMIIEKMRKRS